MLTATEVRRVLQTAITAPSVHNSQPWLFRACADGLDVLADPRRALPTQDPDGRELVLSCAAASLHAQLAVRGLGRACEAIPLPDPARPDVVVRLRVGGPSPLSQAECRLLDAIPRRHTDRTRFADAPVPVHVLDDLGAAAHAEGAWLQVLTTADMLELALWQAHAQAAVAADPAALDERGRWARAEPGPADGLPSAQVPGWPAGQPAGRPAGHAVRFSSGDPADLVLVLGTAQDDRLAWVRAGRALDRVLLTATDAGLVVAPATLALELPALRHGLTESLALRGAPQMVLRTGYPAGPGTLPVGRRPAEEVLLTGTG